jgi:hypothetical protein
MDMEPPKLNHDYYAAINITDSSKPTDVYFCNYCYRKLFYKEQDEETGKHIWWCTRCSYEFIPDNQLTKQKSTLKTPGPDVDNIAIIDDVYEDGPSTSYRKQKLSPLFKALEQRGFKITSYEER